MANTTDYRPLPKSGAETEFDRGVEATPYKSVANQNAQQTNQTIWIFVIVALAVVGGGLYYYMNSNLPATVTPEITQTTPPPATMAPEVVTPPASTPEPLTPPKTTP